MGPVISSIPELAAAVHEAAKLGVRLRKIFVTPNRYRQMLDEATERVMRTPPPSWNGMLDEMPPDDGKTKLRFNFVSGGVTILPHPMVKSGTMLVEWELPAGPDGPSDVEDRNDE